MNTATDHQPGQYAIITVPLSGPNGERLSLGVGAEIFAPGLGIVPEISADKDGRVIYEGGFLLIHIPSGRNIAGISITGGHCITCVHDYAQAAADSGIDWTKSAESTQAAVNAGGERIDALKHAYADLSACGGTNCGDVDEY